MSLVATMMLLMAMSLIHLNFATWCICKGGISDTLLQKTLDYACGAGADCNPTRQGGPCYSPNSVRAHCNYAVNSYFQRNHQAGTACDFSVTASLVTSDPNTTGCLYPAIASSTTPNSVGTTPRTPINSTTVIPTTTTPNGGSPLVTTTTPTTGVLGGGTNTGLNPLSMNPGTKIGGQTMDLKGIIHVNLFTMLVVHVFLSRWD